MYALTKRTGQNKLISQHFQEHIEKYVAEEILGKITPEEEKMAKSKYALIQGKLWLTSLTVCTPIIPKSMPLSIKLWRSTRNKIIFYWLLNLRLSNPHVIRPQLFAISSCSTVTPCWKNNKVTLSLWRSGGDGVKKHDRKIGETFQIPLLYGPVPQSLSENAWNQDPLRHLQK